MSATVLSVHGLSKSYRIGGGASPSATLAETLARRIPQLARALLKVVVS